ncbi:Erf-like ssDNA annealing protein [Rhodobacteraceae phage LS06-2018-MD05]|nr:Erf-like ssDNA annealing protein [Rhodobacteraceae phage LS06-2018-MD05]
MKELLKSLAAFQQEVPIIHKGTQGYGYSYADLPAIFEVINPLLKKNGLVFTQLVNEDHIKTILYHVESEKSIESTTLLMSGIKLAKMNEFQVLGSQITYLRRYALSSMLGLVTDIDNDGAGDDKIPEKQPEQETIWLTKDQYDAAIKADLKGITATLNAFGKKGYAMKKEYRENLTNRLAVLKSQA